MAFGFDDFAKLFDPVSDVLGTSGKQGVGLLQQKPEDIATAAAIAYLAANGLPVTPETLATAEAATAVPSATLVTPEVAALTPEVATNAGIDSLYANSADIANQFALDPTLQASLEGDGTQLAAKGDTLEGIRNLFNGQPFSEPVDLNPPDYRALNTEQLFAQDAAKASLNNVPPGLEAEINSQYYGQNLGGDMGSGIRDAALNANTAQYPLAPSSNLGPTAEEYRNLAENTARYPSGGPTGPSPEMEEFHRALNERSAAAPPSTIQHFDNPAATTQNVFRGNPAEMGYEPPQVTKGGYFNNGINGEYTDTLSPFERGMDTAGRYFDKAANWAEKNPYKAAGLAYYGAYKTGMLDQPKQEQITSDYKNPYTMTGFRRSSPSPSAYRYTPHYAQGGIASVQGYARGGRSKADSAMDFYDAMNPQQSAPPLTHGDPGIYYDMDPDTRYLDPMEASMVRMSKLNSRTNVQAPSMAPSRHMGELNFKPVAAAQGGIMGYAAGGVPMEDEFNRLTARSGGSRTKEDPGEKFNPQNVAIYSSDHPPLSLLGQYLTSPTSTIGLLANFVAPESTKDAYSAWSGVNPEAMRRQEAQPERQLANIRGLESMFGPQETAGVAANPMGTDPSQRGGNGGIGSVGPVGRGEGGKDSDGQHGASLAHGGITGYNLGSYAAGGNPRLLRGPGDGMSDNIPATINHHQPARLADGEYVVTADVVSHLGNGSTEAGAKQLDAMMKRVRKGRTGTPKQGKQIDPRKYLPA